MQLLDQVSGIHGPCLVINVNYAIVVGLTGKDMVVSKYPQNYVTIILIYNFYIIE